jgi:hypothetical protein
MEHIHSMWSREWSGCHLKLNMRRCSDNLAEVVHHLGHLESKEGLGILANIQAVILRLLWS